VASAPGASGAGALGMLVLEAGATETAAVLAGDALRVPRPRVVGVRLRGAMPPGTGGAELLEALARRLEGAARGTVVEYLGEGVASLPMRERVALASLGGPLLGARASVVPSDGATRAWLAARGREPEWRASEGGGEGFDLAVEFDLPRLAAPGPAEVHARFGPLAEDDDLRALAAIARAGASLARVDVVVGGRAARESLAAGATLEALASAGARVLDLADPAAGQPLEPGAFACGDDAEVAEGRARPTSVAALGARLGVPGADRAAGGGHEPAGLATAEILTPAADGDEPVERAPSHVPPAIPSAFEGSPRGVVLRADEGDVPCDAVLGRGPRVHAARGDDAALAGLSPRRADAEAAGRPGPEGFGFVTAAGRYGAGAGHDAAARATRALGIRAVIAGAFEPEHAGALAVQGVLPLVWRTRSDAARVAAGDELELTQSGDALARGRSLSVRALTRGESFVTHVALEEDWRAVVRAGGLVAWLARAAVATGGD